MQCRPNICSCLHEVLRNIMDTMSQLDRSSCKYMHLSLLVVSDLQSLSQHLVHLNGQKKIVQYQILLGDSCLSLNPVPVCRL